MKHWPNAKKDDPWRSLRDNGECSTGSRVPPKRHGGRKMILALLVWEQVLLGGIGTQVVRV